MLRAILSVFFLSTVSLHAMNQRSLKQPLLAAAVPVAGGSPQGSPLSGSPVLVSKLIIQAALPLAGGSPQRWSPDLSGGSASSSSSGSPATGSPAFAPVGAGVAVPALAEVAAQSKPSGLDKLLAASNKYVKRPKFGAKLLRWKLRTVEAQEEEQELQTLEDKRISRVLAKAHKGDQ